MAASGQFRGRLRAVSRGRRQAPVAFPLIAGLVALVTVVDLVVVIRRKLHGEPG